MDQKKLKTLPGARKVHMPEFIPPQLATLVDDPPEGDEWLHEIKFDGYRMLCHLERGQVKFWSRNQKDWSAKFPGLAKAVKALPIKSAILDGEVIAMDTKGRASFQKLQQAFGKTGDSGFVFQIFDCIYLDGFNLTKTPLRQRKEVLEQLLSKVDGHGSLRYSDHVEGNGKAFFDQACGYHIEGIVSKLAESSYDSTRNRNWQKVKCILRQEFVIAGYTESDKGFPGFGALILGVYEKGKLLYAGRAGTGFTIKQRVELRKKLDQIVRDACPFVVRPKDPGLKRAVWVEPKLVGEVAFTEWTAEGSVRHPSFQGLRVDKKAKDVVREKPS
jgi:bifunctional non-homologous end joining protein LigD